MMIFLSQRITADAVGGLKLRAQMRPELQGFGGSQPPTSTRRVYTGALLAATWPHLCILKKFTSPQTFSHGSPSIIQTTLFTGREE